MNKLLKKEILLVMHPTALMFLALSAMLMIPSYPYLVVFFYTSLAVFFTCVTGRENNDVFYTLTLPVRKTDVVRSRFLFVILLELAQLLLAVPFAFLRQNLIAAGNDSGMDANTALFGFAFGMLGLFNFIFLSGYYKDITRVGRPFILSCVAVFVYIGAVEACAHLVPFVRDCLDTPDPRYLPYKLAVLAAGAALYGVLTAAAYARSVQSFQRQDL